MKPRKPLKRSPLPRRKTWLARSSKPIAKRGAAKERKEKRQRAFYSSGTWKKLRKAALERADFTCERCGLPGMRSSRFADLIAVPADMVAASLHVHHRVNVRFGGDERPEDLEVLCANCHRLEHGTAYWRGRHR